MLIKPDPNDDFYIWWYYDFIDISGEAVYKQVPTHFGSKKELKGKIHKDWFGFADKDSPHQDPELGIYISSSSWVKYKDQKEYCRLVEAGEDATHLIQEDQGEM